MSIKPLRICHTVSSLSVSSGGPARTVSQLVGELSNVVGIELNLITQQLRDVSGITVSINNKDAVFVGRTNSYLMLRSGLLIRRSINKLCKFSVPHIIHNHGIWLPSNHWPAVAARRYGIPLVLHPRGMLEPWAMNHHRHIKNLAMAFFQKKDIETAAVIMATSFDEYQNIRKLGFANPVAVVPNGIVFHNDLARHTLRTPKAGRTALFLSRIHPKKGLVNLVNAWNIAKPDGWKLRIAGPDEGGHQSEIMRLIQQLNLKDQISFIGEVDGIAKKNTYLDADLFVLPTFSENFGVVVAEALSYGVPVITTKGTPWQDLETYNCGWWVDVGVEPLVKALQDAMALTDQQRQEMGEKGRHYVQRYNWEDIAQKTADVYRWVLGQADKPDCVYLD